MYFFFLQKQLKLSNMGQQWIIAYLLIACVRLSHQVNNFYLFSNDTHF